MIQLVSVVPDLILVEMDNGNNLYLIWRMEMLSWPWITELKDILAKGEGNIKPVVEEGDCDML